MKVGEKDERKIFLDVEGGKEGEEEVSVSSREMTTLSFADKPQELVYTG